MHPHVTGESWAWIADDGTMSSSCNTNREGEKTRRQATRLASLLGLFTHSDCCPYVGNEWSCIVAASAALTMGLEPVQAESALSLAMQLPKLRSEVGARSALLAQETLDRRK